MAGLSAKLAAALPARQLGGVALAGVAALLLLALLCRGAGLAARAAFARSMSARFESRLNTLYPRYTVIKTMAQGLHGAAGQQVLEPARVSFDNHDVIAFDTERLSDGHAAVYLPGAPDVWSGSVVLVPAYRVAPLALNPVELTDSLAGLGKRMAALLDRAGR